MSEVKIYKLDCGREITLEELIEESGLHKATLYDRLNRKGITDYETLTKKVLKGVYIDEPQEIYGGIIMNPSYLDGTVKGVTRYDRRGKSMQPAAVTQMMKKRRDDRKEWRKSGNIIKR